LLIVVQITAYMIIKRLWCINQSTLHEIMYYYVAIVKLQHWGSTLNFLLWCKQLFEATH